MTTPHNPLDLTGESRDPSWIEEVYAHFCASEPSAAVASLFTLLFDEPFDARAENFARLAESQPDRLFLSATPAALQPKYMDRLKRGGVLTFSSITDLCAGLSLAIDARASDKVLDAEWLRAWAGDRPAMVEGGPVRALVHHEAAQAMAGHDIAFPESRIVRNDASALASAARETGFPVALKLLSESRLHKASSNALAIGITSEEELVEAGRSMQPDPDDLFLVQKMVPAGLDVFVGTVRDANFGNLLIVGAGGGDVERARDTRTLLLPALPEEVLRALGELRIAPALLARSPSGWVWDVDRLVATIMAFSRFVQSAGAGEVMSAEINPLRVFESGAMAIDVRVMLSPAAKEA